MLGLVHEGVRWFGCEVECTLDVVASDEEIEPWRGQDSPPTSPIERLCR